MRRILLVILGFGVFAGFGSAFASARWHARHHGGGCEDRQARFERQSTNVTPLVAPTVVVPQAAPAPAPAPYAAPAPQIFVITVPSGAQQAPIVVPMPTAAPAPAAAQ